MDATTRHAVLQLLGHAMSDVSEECWYAGWLGGTEFYVPELCRRALQSGRPQRWGGDVVTPETALGLAYLADQIGYWADLDTTGIAFAPHQPFPTPAHILADLDRSQT